MGVYYRDDDEYDRREYDLSRARVAEWEASLTWVDCDMCGGKGEVPVQDGSEFPALAICGYCRNGKVAR